MRDHKQYDLIIVGAGPAGLSAARTTARLGFSTLVIERLSGAGELGHPCSEVLVPAPDFVTERPLLGGLFFPQVDLWIPESLVVLPEVTQKCLSPCGMQFQTALVSDAGTSPAAVDKPGLLQMMTDQAAASGAEFSFGTEVAGLLYDGKQVVGVRTDAGDIRATIVFSAEGAGGRLTGQATGEGDLPARHAMVVTWELEAPAVGAADLGRVVTLGKNGADLPTGYGSVSMFQPGRATVSYTALIEDLNCATAESADRYLDLYMQDSRVRDLLAGARPLSKSSHLFSMSSGQRQVVADGFMALGDAATPAGQMGILPAMYVGRQAALMAAEALDSGGVSRDDLAAYEQLCQALVLPALETETKTTVALMLLDDDEVDRLCQLLNWFHLPIPFLGYNQNVEWAVAPSLMRQLPLAAYDYNLLSRIMPPPEEPVIWPEISPVLSISHAPSIAVP